MKMNKILTSTYRTDTITIKLIYEENRMHGAINSDSLTPIRDVKFFIKENARLLGEEEINFIVGFIY